MSSTILACPVRAVQQTAQGQRYAIKSQKDILEARSASVPEKTRVDTNWCINQWNTWCRWKLQLDETPSIMSLSREELAKSMEMFVLEVRKRDGTEYVPNTLYHMVCGIMRHLRASGDISIDFFKNDEFIDFRSTLDGEMKRLTAKGLGATTKKAECIEIDEEETLWSKGILGDHSPSALLNTIFYMNGLYFALRSGKEHRQLRYSPCQIKIIEKEGQIPYLEYSEEISKNNPGGLKGRKITPKVVKHYANLEKP